MTDPAGLAKRFLEPEGFVWGRFAAADGTALRWGALGARPSRMNCVLVGGFTECIEKYFETVRDLTQRGISVWCLDWRGQGGSQRPEIAPSRPRRRDFASDAEDLAGFVAAVLPADRPRLLIAHSMGGAIGLLTLANHPGLFDAAILSAPMLGLATGFLPRPLARGIVHAAAVCGLGDRFIPGAGRWVPDPAHSPERSRTSNDPERFRIEHAWFEARPELQVDGPTFGWVDAAFGLTDRLRRPELLKRIAVPILIGSAGRESLVDPLAYKAAAQHLPSCAIVDFPDAKHELFLERDAVRTNWLAAIDAFIAERM